MSDEPLRLDDWRRIFLGEVPWTFAIEVVIRIGLIYLLLVVSMRLMGKRMTSQSTLNELAALVSLAGGIGPAMQDPKNGLLPALIVAAVVVGTQRTIAVITKNHGRFERLTQGRPTTLVSNGVFDIRALRHIALSRRRVIAHLRGAEITNLGAVDRVYLEIDGAFTVVEAREAKPGLSLLPAWDAEQRDRQHKAKEKMVCRFCGDVTLRHDHIAGSRCGRCGCEERESAVES